MSGRMWAVENHTPYAVGRTWGRNKDGVHEWIVAVRGTFDIRSDDRLVLAAEQPEPLLVPEYNGEDFVSSLRYDADLIGPKPATDVILNGTAYAPGGRPSTEFTVSLRVGDIHKVLRVVGNRRWVRSPFGLTCSAVEPVTSVPIVYERAYGGFDQSSPDPRKQRLDTRNPVGCGILLQEGQSLPNFEYPDKSLASAGPAGFGALDCYWSPRRELSGTYDDAWKNGRFPLLPADWNPRCLLCSPDDQRLDRHMQGGERVELMNLTPDKRVVFQLPKVAFNFQTDFGSRREEHQGWLATVIIEPNRPRVIMVWQTSLLVRSNIDYLNKTVVRVKP